MNAIFQHAQDESLAEAEALADRVPALSAARQHAKDLDLTRFRRVLQGPLDKVVDGVLQAAFPDSRQAQFICKHQTFIQTHFAQVIARVEGDQCSVDKARAIVSRLLRFYAHGDPLRFDRSGTYTFFIPEKIFTTQEAIVSFFEALYRLYYGRPDAYVAALARLLQAPV